MVTGDNPRPASWHRGVVGIDGMHAMIPAFVDVDDEIAEAACRRRGALAVLDHRIEIEIEERELLFIGRHAPLMPAHRSQAKLYRAICTPANHQSSPCRASTSAID